MSRIRRGAARDTPGHESGAPIWRDPAFATIWTGQTASLFGDQVTGLALPWLILLDTHRPLDAGLVAAARYVPIVLIGLVAGTLADRADRRRLLIASDLARALALGIVAAIGALRRAPALWVLALVVLVLGAGQLLFQVAYQAWLPEVTGEARLGEANAAVEAADAASVLVGYPLAGALITAVGPALALGADALSFVVSAITLGRVRTVPDLARAGVVASATSLTPEASARRSASHALAEALAGAREIVARPEQRLLKGAGAALHLAAGAVGVLLATLTQLQLHLPAWQAGFVFGAAGAGGLISSPIAPRVYRWGWRRGLALATGVAALGGLGLAWACVLGPAAGFAVALAANLVLDGALALGFVLAVTANTLLTPPPIRGRVNAAGATFAALVRAIGVVGSGALASGGNPLYAFVVLAGYCLLTVLGTTWVARGRVIGRGA